LLLFGFCLFVWVVVVRNPVSRRIFGMEDGMTNWWTLSAIKGRERAVQYWLWVWFIECQTHSRCLEELNVDKEARMTCANVCNNLVPLGKNVIWQSWRKGFMREHSCILMYLGNLWER
jgi:hypothetical protein